MSRKLKNAYVFSAHTELNGDRKQSVLGEYPNKIDIIVVVACEMGHGII